MKSATTTVSPVRRPGTVKVRLLGERLACAALAALIASSPAAELLTVDGPYANRREPGGRLYLTVRARGEEAGTRSALLVTFDLGDGDTYFVLTEALLDFAARERAAAAAVGGGDPQSRVRLAAVADAAMARINALLGCHRPCNPGGLS